MSDKTLLLDIEDAILSGTATYKDYEALDALIQKHFLLEHHIASHLQRKGYDSFRTYVRDLKEEKHHYIHRASSKGIIRGCIDFLKRRIRE